MENQTKKRQKADIDLEIKLPNVEKPFYNRLSTPDNMIKQIKKAGSKLDEYQTLDVWIGESKNIVLSKKDILADNLKEKIFDRISLLNDLEKAEKNAKSMGIEFGYTSDEKGIKSYNVGGNPLTPEKNFIAHIEHERTNKQISNNQEVNNGMNVDNELADKLNNHYEKQEEPMWNFKGQAGKEILDFALKIDASPDATKNAVLDYIKLEAPQIPDREDFIDDTHDRGQEAYDKALEYYNSKELPLYDDEYKKINEILKSQGFNVDSIPSISRYEANSFQTLLNDLPKFQISKENVTQKQVDENNLNFSYLKDQIKYLGLGEEPKLHKELEEKINSGQKTFSIKTDYDKTSFLNKADFTLNFNRSEKTGNYFLNSFKGHLHNEKKGVDIEHTFAVKRNGYSAKQALNLLEGRSVLSTINDLKEKKEVQKFVSLKLNEPKNEHGNFKINVVRDNNININKIVDASKLKFEDEKHKDITIKSLERGNIVSVKFENKNKETPGFAVLNPYNKNLQLYDKNMVRANTNAAVISENENVKKTPQQSYKPSR